MDEQTYNRIMNGCCLIGIGSMLFFERAGEWQGVVVAGGLLAGLAAASVYLYDRLHHKEEESSSAEKGEAVNPSPSRHANFARPAADILTEGYKGRSAPPSFTSNAIYIESHHDMDHFLISEQMGVRKLVRRRIYVGHSREHSIRETAIGSVIRMAEMLPQHEFEITQDGRVITRPSGKQRKVETPARTKMKEEENFSPYPSRPGKMTLH